MLRRTAMESGFLLQVSIWWRCQLRARVFLADNQYVYTELCQMVRVSLGATQPALLVPSMPTQTVVTARVRIGPFEASLARCMVLVLLSQHLHTSVVPHSANMVIVLYIAAESKRATSA